MTSIKCCPSHLKRIIIPGRENNRKKALFILKVQEFAFIQHWQYKYSAYKVKGSKWKQDFLMGLDFIVEQWKISKMLLNLRET